MEYIRWIIGQGACKKLTFQYAVSWNLTRSTSSTVSRVTITPTPPPSLSTKSYLNLSLHQSWSDSRRSSVHSNPFSATLAIRGKSVPETISGWPIRVMHQLSHINTLPRKIWIFCPLGSSPHQISERGAIHERVGILTHNKLVKEGYLSPPPIHSLFYAGVCRLIQGCVAQDPDPHSFGALNLKTHIL